MSGGIVADTTLKDATLTVMTDGGVDAKNKTNAPCYCAFIAYHSDENGIYDIRSRSIDSVGTSNEAEYKALWLGLNELLSLYLARYKNISFMSDSKLMVSQMNGIWKVKDIKLREIHKQCKDLVDYFYKMGYPKITFYHVKRAFNKEADAMCNLAKTGVKKSVAYQALSEFATQHNLTKNKVFKSYVKKETKAV